MEEKKSRDKVVPGTIGALLGSMLGAAYLVVQGQSKMSFMLLGSVVMAVCTLQGYAMLGGRLSRRGAMISLGIMAAAIYLANGVNCTVEIMETVEALQGLDFFVVLGGFRELPEVQEIRSWYRGQLALLYLFTLAGSLPPLVRTFRKSPERPEKGQKAPKDAEPYEEAELEKPELQGTFYPFRKAWMKPMRLSVGMPVLALLAALLAPLLLVPRLEEHFHADLGAGMLAGVFLSLILLMWITLSITRQCNSFQFLFVRAGGRLWRINLMKLCHVGDWEVLPPARQEALQDDILWELGNILEGDSFYYGPGVITELRNIRGERETRWNWTVSYETEFGERKKLKIPRGYPDFTPVPGMGQAQGPVPVRWMPALAALALSASFLGGGVALDLWRTPRIPDRPPGTDPVQLEADAPAIPVRVPENTTEYEMSEVWFRVDSDFQQSRRSFLDVDTGTSYRAYVQYGVGEEGAWDTLVRHVDEYRDSPLYDRHEMVYSGADLLAPLGEAYRYNIASVYLTDGRALHTAAVLSDAGTLFTMEAESLAQSAEEVLANLMFTLESVRFEGPAVSEENYQSQIHVSEIRDCAYIAAAYLKTDLFGHNAFVDVYVPYSDFPIYSAGGRAIRTEAHGLRVYATVLPGKNAKEVIETRYRELAATGRVYEDGIEDELYREDLDVACKLTVYEENGQKRYAVLYADSKWTGYYLLREITGLPELTDEEYPALLKELEGIIGLTIPALEQLAE